MRWVIATSKATEHIIPVQKWLFDKYAPEVDLNYITTGVRPINEWCAAILEKLEMLERAKGENDYIVFGLDDYLPISLCKQFASISKSYLGYDRFGFGYSDSKSKHVINHDLHIEYTDKTPYSVTCQFSIWKTSALKRVLKEVDGSPWDFEVKGKCKALALKEPAFRWIEESALSKKWPGVNVLGLKPEDVNSLVSNNLLNRSDLVYYLGKGRYDTEFKKEYAGDKYGFNYDL